MASARATWIAFHAVVSSAVCARGRGSSAVSLRTWQRPTSTSSRFLPRNSRWLSTTRPDEPPPSGNAIKPKGQARKAARKKASNTSLKRTAIEAERSRSVIKGTGKRAHVDREAETKDVTAYCAAETYNIHVARRILKQEGYEPDPFNTDLYPQVLHVQTPNFVVKDAESGESREQGAGDVFVFPSGTVVAWNVPEALAHRIVERLLPGAAEGGHLDKLEAEDLEYLEDPTRETSKIIGDTIILGTKSSTELPNDEVNITVDEHRREADTVLAKIAFSSALARSTKLAVLENLLSNYFTTTRSIPARLSAGSRLRFSRAFILKKTGELLSLRAQLNLYSELTDSLPDLFWDSPHELGLESYYEQVGRALDIGSRIKLLNERMDYASEIAAVLRERLSEKHSTELEWLIIFLISVEVVFEVWRLWREREEERNPGSTEALLQEFLRRELELHKRSETQTAGVSEGTQT